MTIGKDKVVSLSYVLSSRKDKAEAETIVERTEAVSPFVFLFGHGGVIEGFELNLKGKQKGDTFDFHIEPAKAYGEFNPKYVIPVPIDAFKNDKGELDRTMLTPGKALPMRDNQGNNLEGIIRSVTITEVVMDFNHPMAGHELHFIGEVVEVREASKEELDHGHVHGAGGHHHH